MELATLALTVVCMIVPLLLAMLSNLRQQAAQLQLQSDALKQQLADLEKQIAERDRKQEEERKQAAEEAAKREKLDKTIGFKRPEMWSERLLGTLKPYDCHIFFGTGADSAMSWPFAVESTGVGATIQRAFDDLCTDLRYIGQEMKCNPKLTACDEPVNVVLVFPQCVRFEVLDGSEPTHDQAVNILGAVLSPTEELRQKAAVTLAELGVRQTPLNDSYIFVCSHNARDKRCGYQGPILAAALESELSSRRAASPSSFLSGRGCVVRKCSHIGGHAYAGNVLVFHPRRLGDRTVMGDWYGYVTPAQVPAIVDAMEAGKVLGALLRGTMGLTAEDMHRMTGGGGGGEKKDKGGHKKGEKKERDAAAPAGTVDLEAAAAASQQQQQQQKEREKAGAGPVAAPFCGDEGMRFTAGGCGPQCACAGNI